MENATSGVVLSIQRFSTEDGPGIRSTAFLKQCPLRCRWCQNPESLSSEPELEWFAARCIGCRSCTDACSRGAVALTGAGICIDRSRCQGCGDCAAACPADALQVLGRRVEASVLAAELARDRAWYDQSGGGVTLSGGEPLAQPAFTIAVLGLLRGQGIRTAIDTCGMAGAETIAGVLPMVDLVLYDLKLADPLRHRDLTGQANEPIFRNLLAIAQAVRAGKGGLSLWIRTPLVPGATAVKENVRAIGSFLAEHLDGAVGRWELCAFNNLCRDKYRRLGIAWDYAETPLMRREEMEELLACARSSGVSPALISCTGETRTAVTT